MSAKQFNYFDDWKNELLECPNCHWQGTFDQGSVEHYMEQMDAACPKCDVAKTPILAIVLYPTLPELRANMDKPGVREWVERIDRGFDEFEAQKLREPSQLPDIADGSFELVWDFDNSNPNHPRTIVKHGQIVVFSEPARYEEFKRFGEICEILKEKYGVRIEDLVPTLRSEDWLYGAASEAKNFVEWSRLHHFGASIAKQQQSHLAAKSLARSLSVYESANQEPAQDQPEKQLTLNFETKSARPVPGVPGASWKRTEDGTVLTLEPNAEFDALSKEVQSEMLDRMLKCFDKPNHIQRVTALRDEFANRPADKAQSQPRDWPSAFDHFQYGSELPDIDAEEVSLVFDYSHDGSKYFVLYGEQIILSGPATDDPEDHVTDDALGEQFIEIAKKLKARYGAKLVDLIPTPKAENMLMDLWGWACKLDRGRRIVQQQPAPAESTKVGSDGQDDAESREIAQQGSTPTESPSALKNGETSVGSRHLRGLVPNRTHTKLVLSFFVGFALMLGAYIARQHQERRFPAQQAPARQQSSQIAQPHTYPDGFSPIPSSAAVPATSPVPVEQTLHLTGLNSLAGGSEAQRLDGTCSMDTARESVTCDIHNGFPDWKITEIMFFVRTEPAEAGNIYRQRVSIAPFETATVTLRLGMQVDGPTWNRQWKTWVRHWNWTIAEVKGIATRSLDDSEMKGPQQ